MKKKYFIFGGSSKIAQNFLVKTSKKYEKVCFSSKKLKQIIPNVKYICTDYSRSKIEKILKRIVKKEDKNIFLFFNGISEQKAFYKLNEKEIKKIINVNLTLPILITNIIVKNFFSRNINCIYFSSSRALKLDNGISMYASTKKGIQSFVKSMALEYGNLGLNFRVISLGLFDGGLEKTISEKTRKNIFRRSSIKKNIQTNQLYKVIEFIIEDKTGNGSTIQCDNGYF